MPGYTSPFLAKLMGRGAAVVSDATWANLEQAANNKRQQAGYRLRDWDSQFPGYCASVPLLQPAEINAIPFDEIGDRIKERDAHFGEPEWSSTEELLIALGVKTKNQYQTNLCHVFCVASMVEADKVLSGIGYEELSAISLGCWVNGYRNVGGFPVENCNVASWTGIALESEWPLKTGSRYNFRKPKNEEDVKLNAATRRVHEFRELPVRNLTWRQKTSIVFSLTEDQKTIASGHDFMRHAILLVGAYFYDDQLVILSRNSGLGRNNKGYTLYGAQKIAYDDAVVCNSTLRGA